MKRFETRVDGWLWAVFALPVVIGVWLGILVGSWWIALLGLVFGLLIACTVLRINYTIDGNRLMVTDSFTVRTYPIDNIQSVQKTFGFLASPAGSTRRVAIKFKRIKRPMTAMPLEVSPRDRDAFIAALLQVNPSIKILPPQK